MAKEYIEREAVLSEYDRQHNGKPGGARKIISEFPAADVRPVRHGRWKRVDPRSTVVTFRCSECNYYANMDATNFCPQCGAQMDADMWEVDDDCRRT